jgi:hypothetical protein
VGEREKPHYYIVGLVHVRVEAGESQQIPTAALKLPPIRLELFTDDAQKHFENLVSDLS